MSANLEKETKIKTFLRIKDKRNAIKIVDNAVECIEKQNRKLVFEFDRIFDNNASNEDIFGIFIPHLEEPVSMTILAYGKTGSGKTYTMSGHGNTLGLIQMIVNYLIDIKTNNNDSKDTTCKLYISFIEIYNERLFDCIDNKEKQLREMKDMFFVPDLSKTEIFTMEQFNESFNKFINTRKQGQTLLNNRSSRSHSLARIEINGKIINLVDLAGSENNKRTGSTGERLKESQCINTSLFVLNKVVKAMSENEALVPYRDSKLTKLLKESLKGKCFVIATVIDEIDETGLTINTLNFAAKTRQIKTVEKTIDVDNKTDVIETARKIKVNMKQGISIASDPVHQIKESSPYKTNKPNNALQIKSTGINSQIEMTPVTKQKSKACFLSKAIEYEKAENYKMAIHIYNTINKIDRNDEIENKINELRRIKKPIIKTPYHTALKCLNLGSFLDLKQLKGIGDRRAKIITDFVAKGNKFQNLDDLTLLFNNKTVEKIKENIEEE